MTLNVVLLFFTSSALYLVANVQAVHLTVGAYNYIPDLNHDNLKSYKSLIENGFRSIAEGHTIDVVIDGYDPYGDLSEFLSNDGLDLIEIDTAVLKSVVDNDLVVPVGNESVLDPVWQEYFVKDSFLPAAKKAVTLDSTVFGIPTLVCGNFLVSFTPDGDILTGAQNDYDSLRQVMNELKENCINKCERVIGGKMNGEWYLPFLYLDGLADINNPSTLQPAVSDILEGHVDTEVCKRLSWFIRNCNDWYGRNKCFDSSYDDDNVLYSDIEEERTSIYFGFSEIAAKIKGRRATAAISWPLGQYNIPLQFTDGLVINKARWDAANEDKKKAIRDFIVYYLSDQLRDNIAMGTDLDEPQPRYLLQATRNFYLQTDNRVYQQLFHTLLNALPAPQISESKRSDIQNILVEKCVKINPETTKEEL